MTRGYTPEQIDRLERKIFKTEVLLEMYLPNQTFYFTTGEFDVRVNTPTNPGPRIFQHESFVTDIGTVKEGFFPLPTKINLTFQRLTGNFINFMNKNSINSTVVLYRLFRKQDTNAAEETDGLLNYFTGKISGLDIQTSVASEAYVIRCSSDFGDYKNTNYRTTADIFGTGFGEKINWGDFVFNQ